MSPRTYRDERELLILDTGPIRELILYHAVFSFGFEGLRRELRCLTHADPYDRCVDFVASFRRRTTSASVVSELNCWIRKTERQGQERLWNRIYDQFRGMEMNEEVIRLLHMDIQMVARFGPVDVSIIKLAERHRQERPVVLTIDQALCGICKDAGLGVRHLHEIE
jgi:hypothetical protein